MTRGTNIQHLIEYYFFAVNDDLLFMRTET